MTRRRLDPHSWTVVRLPERDLAACVLDTAEPLLAALEPAHTLEDARGAVELAVTFWNASVEASEQWEYPRKKPLGEVKKRLRGSRALDGSGSMFDALVQRKRATAPFDPRLVTSWSYDRADGGEPRLTCEMALPEGVRAAVPPPIEKRISIAGAFLDEVFINQGANTRVGFSVDNHRGTIGVDGTATIEARMPAALQLLADGRLPRIGGTSVDLMIRGQRLPSMVLSEVRCGGYGNDIAVLVFKPSGTSSKAGKDG